jgi:hypothetical protein
MSEAAGGAPAGGVMHPGAPAAAPAAQPTTPQPAPATERRRIGEMRELHQRPAPGPQQLGNEELLHTPTVLDRHRGADDIPGIGVDAQAQAIARLAEPDPIQAQAQIEVDGQVVTPEQYQELLEKWRSDDLHEELMERFVTAKIDGKPLRIPVQEAVMGYQRNVDYSNGMADVARGRAENDRTRAGFLNILRDMDDGHSFLRAVDHLGKMPGFEAAAKLYAVRYAALKKMTPEQRGVYERNQQLERDNFQKDLRLRELEQAQAAQVQQQATPDERHLAAQLAQMIPIAMKRAGVDHSPLYEDFFNKHWAQHCQGVPGFLDDGPTTAKVQQVVVAAQQDMAKHVAQRMAEQQQGKPLPPTARMPSAAPTGGQTTNGQPVRKRIGDMRELSGVPRR